ELNPRAVAGSIPTAGGRPVGVAELCAGVGVVAGQQVDGAESERRESVMGREKCRAACGFSGSGGAAVSAPAAFASGGVTEMLPSASAGIGKCARASSAACGTCGASE